MRRQSLGSWLEPRRGPARGGTCSGTGAAQRCCDTIRMWCVGRGAGRRTVVAARAVVAEDAADKAVARLRDGLRALALTPLVGHQVADGAAAEEVLAEKPLRATVRRIAAAAQLQRSAGQGGRGGGESERWREAPARSRSAAPRGISRRA